MDDHTSRIMEELRRDPSRLQSLLRSPDGQALMQLLNQDSQNSVLHSAAQSASQGNSAEAMKQVKQYLQTPDGAALADRVRKLFKK